MNDRQQELLLDCINSLWSLSKRVEDYWLQVASLESEECLSLFDSIRRHPAQLQNLFAVIEQDEADKIIKTFGKLISAPRGQTPGFFEISLWAAVIEAKSPTFRKEIFRLAMDIDYLSRKLIGSPATVSEIEFIDYLELAKKFTALTKHLHPAFSHSDFSPVSRRHAA